MAEHNENLLDWLRNAHAMEQQAEQMLKTQASRIQHYPELKARIEAHIDETLQQQRIVEDCITRLGGKPSIAKDFAAKTMAFGQAVGGMANTDEIVKGAIAGYVFEHVEIATYTTLIAAAQAAGDTATQRACEAILPQEQAMAEWLLKHLPQITTQFLARDATEGAVAKR